MNAISQFLKAPDVYTKCCFEVEQSKYIRNKFWHTYNMSCHLRKLLWAVCQFPLLHFQRDFMSGVFVLHTFAYCIVAPKMRYMSVYFINPIVSQKPTIFELCALFTGAHNHPIIKNRLYACRYYSS